MSYKTTHPQGAFELMQQGATYLDVRSTQEYAARHPKGSVNIPVFEMTATGRTQNPHFISEVEKQFKKDQPLVLGCATGGRSAMACELLTQAGYTSLTNCDGSFMGKPGIPGWKALGLPVE